jgi:hypothetical protein
MFDETKANGRLVVTPPPVGGDRLMKCPQDYPLPDA